MDNLQKPPFNQIRLVWEEHSLYLSDTDKQEIDSWRVRNIFRALCKTTDVPEKIYVMSPTRLDGSLELRWMVIDGQDRWGGESMADEFPNTEYGKTLFRRVFTGEEHERAMEAQRHLEHLLRTTTKSQLQLAHSYATGMAM